MAVEVHVAARERSTGNPRSGGGGGRIARKTARAGKDWGISLYTPVIVKYRHSKTDARVQLEDLLR
ncbi:MAG TPA: hypothetical protein VIY49_18470 [Bryobacteraceae bacterium]